MSKGTRIRSKRIKVRKSWFEQWVEARENETNVPWRGIKRPGAGWTAYIPFLPEWQGTSRHTCGMWPFPHGSAAPIHGSQVGVHAFTREPVGFDPLSWFDLDYIYNPSCYVLANPAVGKSSLLRKMMAGTIACGTNVIVLGDRKNEHTKLIRLMGGTIEDDGEFGEGQIIHLGPGKGKLNILDPGGVADAVKRIMAECKNKELAVDICDGLVQSMHTRRAENVVGLVNIYRHARPEAIEKTLIDQSLRWLYENESGVPILADLIRVLRDAPKSVRKFAYDGGDDDEYKRIIRPLMSDLIGLTSGGGIGAMFDGPSTAQIRRDVSVCFDINSIAETDKDALAAAYIACWAAGFGMIDVAHAMSDAGLEDPRRFLAVMDEFWQPLSASPGMVDRVNGLTRLNRDKGVGMVYASHTMSDLETMPEASDRAKARDIVSRCGAVVVGGLRRNELEDRVSPVIKLRKEEVNLLVGWNVTRSLAENADEDMPGRGKFLIKTSEHPGLPIDVQFTQYEIDENIHDTNARIRKYRKEAVAA